MSFLLDTNAISEPGRKAPDPGFLAWYGPLDGDEVFLSAITIGELRRGLDLLPDDGRRARLERLHGAIALRFADKVLAVDTRVAETWGALSARLQQRGRVVDLGDQLIAATALAHDLTLVTRNVRHFEASGCKLLSPWTA